MICSKGCTRLTSLEGIWKKALQLAESDKKVSADIRKARALNPWHMTETDFLRQCARAVLGARRRYGALEKWWADMERVFFKWDIGRIVEEPESVKARALQVLNSPKRVDEVIEIARWLKEREWPAVHAELLGFIRKDKGGNPAVTKELIGWLDRVPGVGRALASSIARDLVIGRIRDDVWMCRLAGWLGYSADRSGVWQMSLEIQIISGEKISVIDVALRNWTKTQEWLDYVSVK